MYRTSRTTHDSPESRVGTYIVHTPIISLTQLKLHPVRPNFKRRGDQAFLELDAGDVQIIGGSGGSCGEA
jgi:hypothetical protein